MDFWNFFMTFYCFWFDVGEFSRVQNAKTKMCISRDQKAIPLPRRVIVLSILFPSAQEGNCSPPPFWPIYLAPVAGGGGPLLFIDLQWLCSLKSWAYLQVIVMGIHPSRCWEFGCSFCAQLPRFLSNLPFIFRFLANPATRPIKQETTTAALHCIKLQGLLQPKGNASGNFACPTAPPRHHAQALAFVRRFAGHRREAL